MTLQDINSKKEELRQLFGKYRGARALLLTRVSSESQSHDAQERVIRELLIDNLDLRLDEERHVKHDTYTGLEYRYRAMLDEILNMAECREFDVLCLDVLDRGLGRKGVSREIFRGQLRELGIQILTTEKDDHSDDDSLEGQLMRLLRGYKAEEEINDFVRRSKNGKRHKALGDPEKNIPPKVIGYGGRPYGYKYVRYARKTKGPILYTNTRRETGYNQIFGITAIIWREGHVNPETGKPERVRVQGRFNDIVVQLCSA